MLRHSSAHGKRAQIISRGDWRGRERWSRCHSASRTSISARRGDNARLFPVWIGGFTTCWYCDPREDLVGILLTQRLMNSPALPAILADFWTLTYQAIDD